MSIIFNMKITLAKYSVIVVLLLLTLLGYATEPSAASAGMTQKRIKAVFPERFPPVYNVTVDNIPTGFGINILEAVASQAGIDIDYVAVSSWEEAIEQLQNGQADIIPNFGITDSRKNFAAFTRPINKIPVSLLVLHQTKAFATLSDLRHSHYIVGVVGNNVGVRIMQAEPTIRSKLFPRLVDALLDLSNKQIDAIIYPVPAAKSLAKNLRLKGELQALGPPLMEIFRAIAVKKSNPELLELLDKSLATVLASDSYNHIYKRWHPDIAFWNNTRVAYLVGVIFILGLSAVVYFRFKVLRRINTELTQSNRFIKTVMNITTEGILTLDQHGIIHTVNKAAAKIFSRSESDLINSSISKLMPENEAKEFMKLLLQYRLNKEPGVGVHLDDYYREYRVLAKDGNLFSVKIAFESAIINEAIYYICSIEDVSQLREAQNLSDFYINHDPMTGLVNQNGFNILFENIMIQAKRHKRPLSCLHIEIDHMSAINNSYGRNIGDVVLIEFTKRLNNIIRDSDLIGVIDIDLLVRVSGTRFVVVLPETGITQAIDATRRILHEIEKKPLQVKDKEINVTCKIGVASSPEHGDTASDLLLHSEAALRVARSNFQADFHVYAAAEDNIKKNTDVWVEKIISGLHENRFFLLFQPILDIKTGQVRHCEALVRYRDINNQIISPDEFIPVAERYGSIKQLDRRIAQLAISHLAGVEASNKELSIAINLSGANIGDPELFEWLERLFEENELQPKHIIFEITETASLFSITAARSFIDSIKALGCRIALDDFGTGLSSFTYLRNFPVDILKIDGSFIRNLPNSYEDRVMVKSMVDVAHSLGKQVVAEFVSSREIYDIVKDFGVDYAQGYFISKPDYLEELMKRESPWI